MVCHVSEIVSEVDNATKVCQGSMERSRDSYKVIKPYKRERDLRVSLDRVTLSFFRLSSSSILHPLFVSPSSIDCHLSSL